MVGQGGGWVMEGGGWGVGQGGGAGYWNKNVPAWILISFRLP